MSNKQGGFTLIELILVIVILGILAVVALPRFIDLQDEAAQAATDGVAGALSSGSAINYAASLAGGTTETVLNCDQADQTIQGQALPTGYSINSLAVPAGDTESACTVTHPDGQTANFTVYGVS